MGTIALALTSTLLRRLPRHEQPAPPRHPRRAVDGDVKRLVDARAEPGGGTISVDIAPFSLLAHSRWSRVWVSCCDL